MKVEEQSDRCRRIVGVERDGEELGAASSCEDLCEFALMRRRRSILETRLN